MLVQFSVENYMSIRERAVLNLTASNSDNEHLNNLFEYEKLRCLRSVVIYGPNASGKSSLLKAMTAAIMTIRESQSVQVNSRLVRIVPFLFDDVSKYKPSSFEFVMMIDGLRYVYGFSATREKVVDEYLYVYHTAKSLREATRPYTSSTRQTKRSFLLIKRKRQIINCFWRLLLRGIVKKQKMSLCGFQSRSIRSQT